MDQPHTTHLSHMAKRLSTTGQCILYSSSTNEAVQYQENRKEVYSLTCLWAVNCELHLIGYCYTALAEAGLDVSTLYCSLFYEFSIDKVQGTQCWIHSQSLLKIIAVDSTSYLFTKVLRERCQMNEKKVESVSVRVLCSYKKNTDKRLVLCSFRAS